MKPNVLINWGLVAQYVSTTQFDHYFEDEAWKNLLDIQEEVYSALTYEFMATFKISFPRASGLRNPVSFYCQGQYHNVEIREFIKCLEINDDDFLDSDKFS